MKKDDGEGTTTNHLLKIYQNGIISTQLVAIRKVD